MSKMVKKLKKQYETPNEGWNEERIAREDELIEEFGLKNKKEVYRAQSQLRSLRREARDLVASENEQERKELIEKANRLGLVREGAELGEILSLKVTDFLGRRLQTAVNRRGLSDTPREARQLVVHGHVYVDGQRVTTPGYLLTQEEEKEIELRMPEPDEKEETTEDEEEETSDESSDKTNSEGEAGKEDEAEADEEKETEEGSEAEENEDETREENEEEEEE